MYDKIINPFVGLKPYSEKNKDFYFGREQEVENLLQILQKNKLLTLSGNSGGGKTSLINASLIPRLKNGFIGQAGKEWSIAYLRPGVNPISNLANALTANGVLNIEAKPKTTDYKYYSKLIKEYEAVGIVEIYKRSEIYEKKNLLIIIDQLEDLFKFKEYFQTEESGQEYKLMDLIYRSVSYKNMSIYFLLSIESNYLTKINSYKKLQEIISPTQYTIQNLDYIKINHIIEKTFYKHGVRFDQEVLDYFEQSLDKKIGYLPNFQFLLYNIFEKYIIEKTAKKVIDFQDVKEFGGIENAISTSLETFYLALNKKEQNKLSLLFKALIKPQNTSIEGNYEKIINISEYVNSTVPQLSESIKSLKKNFSSFIEVFESSISRIKDDQIEPFNSESILNLKYSTYLNWALRQEWIAEEKKEYLKYKTFSENAIKKDNGEVDFIKTLELESAIAWRNNPNNNCNWAKKYNFNFNKTVAYINDSENDNLRLKKEKEDQYKREQKKEKTKRKGYIFFILICFIFALITLNNSKKATKLKEKAQDEAEANLALKKKADSLKIIAEKDARISFNLKIKADSLRSLTEVLIDKTLEEKRKLTRTLKDLSISEEDRRIKTDSINNIIIDLERSENKANNESERNKTIKQLIELKFSFNDLKIDLNRAFQEKDKDKIKSLIAESIWKQEKFDSLRNRKDIPYISDDNLLELNKKILSVLEEKTKYSQTSMLLAKSTDYSIRDFDIYKNKIAFGGDKGELQFYDIKKSKKLNAINVSGENIEDRIRTINFIDENSLFVTTFSGKVLKINRKPLQIKTIYNFVNQDIIDFFIDKNDNRQYLILKDEIRTYDKEYKIVNSNDRYKNIEASFYKDSKLFLISDKKLFVLEKFESKHKIIASFKLTNINKASALHVSNKYLFVGTETGEVICYDYLFKKTKQLKLNYEFNLHKSSVNNLYFDEDKASQILYTASLDNKIFRHDFKLSKDKAKNAYTELMGHEKWIWHMETYKSKDNQKMLLTADEDGNLLSWFTETDDLLKKIKIQFKIY